MSYTVTIEKECGCFKKSGIELPKTFENAQEAENEANDLASDMNATFCHKHSFSVKKEENGYVIGVTMAEN